MAAQGIGQHHYATLKTSKGLSAKIQILSLSFHRSSLGSFWAYNPGFRSWGTSIDVFAGEIVIEQWFPGWQNTSPFLEECWAHRLLQPGLSFTELRQHWTQVRGAGGLTNPSPETAGARQQWLGRSWGSTLVGGGAVRQDSCQLCSEFTCGARCLGFRGLGSSREKKTQQQRSEKGLEKEQNIFKALQHQPKRDESAGHNPV